MQVLWLEDGPHSACASALAALCADRLVVFPTDTVYGLLGSTHSPCAYEDIYIVKQRPRDKPLALLIARESGLYRSAWSSLVRWPELQAAFAAGRITAVLEPEQLPDLPPAVTATQSGPIGLRCPDHLLLQRLLHAVGCPLWATSANAAGEVTSSAAQQLSHWLEQLTAPVALAVLSRSPLPGQPSHVVRISGDSVQYLR